MYCIRTRDSRDFHFPDNNQFNSPEATKGKTDAILMFMQFSKSTRTKSGMNWTGLGIEQHFRLVDDLDLDVASSFISFILFIQEINIYERTTRAEEEVEW